jgi:hypothetical protein
MIAYPTVLTWSSNVPGSLGLSGCTGLSQSHRTNLGKFSFKEPNYP